MNRWITLTCVAALLAGAAHANDWKRVWSDEFEVDGLPDPSKWGYEVGHIRNNERQYYTEARKENVRVENGRLIIEARKEQFPNANHKPDSEDWRERYQFAKYTAASIHTLGKQEFLYGRIEVKAKMPQGQGVWPAIWTLGVNRSEVGWPRCGEIDIMEYTGKQPHTIHANNHFANPAITDPSLSGRAIHQKAGGGKTTVQEPYNNFHVYAIEWDEEKIKFFVDDTHYATLDVDLAGKGADNPYRKPHYLLLNFALGGSMGGRIDGRIFPQKYEIEYVRYYQK